MFRHAARASLRSSHSSLAPARTVASRRYISTEPPHMKSRSWKSSALRWGIAIAGIYYYNTSPIFADHPKHNLLNPNIDALDDNSGSSTIDALTASSRNKPQRDASVLQSAIEKTSEIAASDSPAAVGTPQDNPMVAAPTVGAAELEEEAEGEGAFNPVTGEINWDCPCLGGMAYGPCGPEFREAFSCFVYSQEEPKGMNCIDKFQKMQTCFRAHPEVYKDELEGDDELDENLAQEKEELEREIAERRAALDAHAGRSSQGRLLEEVDNAPTKLAKSDKSSSKSDSAEKSSSNESSRKVTTSKSSPAEPHSEAAPQGESKTKIEG